MNSYSVIECTMQGAVSYYARGIFLTNIPLEKADTIRLLKCTHIGSIGFYHDCMPAFKKFQRVWKAWFRILRNPKTFLNRELGDSTLKRFSPRKHLQ